MPLAKNDILAASSRRLGVLSANARAFAANSARRFHPRTALLVRTRSVRAAVAPTEPNEGREE